MKKYVLTLLLGACSCFSVAQPAARQLSLKECIEIALENNLNIKRSENNLDIFKISLLQARGAFLPSLNAGSSYNQNYGRALNPVSNLFEERNSTTLNVQGVASLTVFNSLRLQNTLRQSQRDVLAADKDLAKAKNDVTLNVVTLYTNVILNRELFENARFQLNSSQQQLERITRQVAAGALPLANQLNQEAQVATNEVNLINQENALVLSILQLKQAMLLPAAERIDVEVPELPVEDLILSQTSEEIFQMALQIMPEIQSARLRIESNEFALKAARAQYYPRLSLNASAASNYASLVDGPFFSAIGTPTLVEIGQVGTDPNPPPSQRVYRSTATPVLVRESYGYTSQLQDNLFKSVGLQLNIPILNGFQTRGGVQRAIINKENAQLAVVEAENTLRQAIETAYNDAVATAKVYSSSLKQVQAQEEAYRINKQRYELGAITFIEYNVSENSLFQARSDLVRAKYNFIFRKKILDFYQGKNLEF